MDAGLELSKGNYDDAVTGFASLGALYDAENMANESTYRKAGQAASNDNHDEAIALYEELGDYKDAKKLVGDTICRKGYYLIELKKFDVAIKVFESLKDINYVGYDELILDANYQCARSMINDSNYIKAYDYLQGIQGYKDAGELLQAVTYDMYSEAIMKYRQEDYYEALSYFDKLDGYGKSEDYSILCIAHNSDVFESTFWNRIVPLIGFEDVDDLIVSKRTYSKYFLEGTWRGEGYYFKMKDDGHINYDLPWFDFGDYYRISDGILMDEETNRTRNLFKITILTEDCINMYAYKNGRTYTLYRQ